MTLGNFKLVIGAIFLFAHTFALPAAGTPAAKRTPVEEASFLRSLRSISVPLDMHNFEPVVDDDENRQRRVAIRLGHAEKPHLEFDPVFYRSPSWRTNRHKRMYGTGWLSLPSRLRTPIINHLNDIATCSLKF